MIGAVILNYRTAADAARAALEVRAGGVDHVIIVDNASGDDDCAYLKESAEQVDGIELLASDLNQGYSRGNNLGLRRLWEVGCDLAIVANPDISFPPGAVRALIAAKISDPEAAIVAPTLVEPDGAVEVKGGRWRYRVGRGELETQCVDVDVRSGSVRTFSGACYVVDLPRFIELGLLPEDHFLYGEEVDVVQRLGARGWSWHTVDVCVIHRRGGSIGSATEWRNRSLVAHHYAAQSAVLVTRKYWMRWLPVVVVARTAFGFAAAMRGRVDIAMAIWRGILSGLTARVIR